MGQILGAVPLFGEGALGPHLAQCGWIEAHLVSDGDPTPSPLKGAQPQLLTLAYCGQPAGWMKTPHGTEVDLGRGPIVLDGDRISSPLPAKGAQQPLLFSAHVYCGHGRPSQLLLSSCTE